MEVSGAARTGGKIGSIAWHGPRPLRKGETLVGRRDELREVYDVCQSYDVMQLTAATGIGKTSFVKAGLIPTLERGGFDVYGPRPWAEATEAANLEEFGADEELGAERLYRAAIGAPMIERRAPNEIFAPPEGRDKRVVVVLDQFEEILRYQPIVAEHLLRLAGRIARDHEVPHLVIARSEHSQGLRHINVPRTVGWSKELPEISDPDVLAEIVRRGAKDVGVQDDAVEQLVEWWSDARAIITTERARRRAVEGLAEVGLLQFQALLWSLKTFLAEQDGPLTKVHVRKYAQDRAKKRDDGATVTDAPAWLLQDALAHYVEHQTNLLKDPATVKLGRPREPLSWRNGPRLTLARIAPTLSAAGYKQPQTLTSLLPTAAGEELTQGRARDLAERLAAAGVPPPDPDYELEDHLYAVPRILGAGPARDWPSAQITTEIVDALHAALKTLSDEDVNVLRSFDGPGQSVFELVHDGMGAALETWARAFLRKPLAVVGVIAQQPGTAVRLEELSANVISDPDEPLELWGDVTLQRDADSARAVVGGLGWPATAILDTRITNVTFRECDFTGASFVDCTLKNVTFAGCKLTGGLLLRCGIDNVRVEASADQDVEAYDLFTVKAPAGEPDMTFANLRDTTGLFLTAVGAGRWKFECCERIRHLVVKPSGPVELEFFKTHAAPVSAPKPLVSIPVRDESTLGFV